MATLKQLIETPNEVLNEGENPFQYLVAQGDYRFPRSDTIELDNKVDSILAGSRNKEGQIYFITKLDYKVEIQITTKRNGYFQGIERNVGSDIFQRFGINTSRGGGKSQMNVTLNGGSMIALHVGGQGSQEWGHLIGEDNYFSNEVQARGIKEPSSLNDGLLISLTNEFNTETYSIVANDPDKDTQITIVGFTQITPNEAVIPTLGDVVSDDEESSVSDIIQGSTYEVIDEFNGVDVDGYSYSVILAFDDVGYFIITDGSKSDYIQDLSEAKTQFDRQVEFRQEQAEFSDKEDISEQLPIGLDILKGEIQGLNTNLMLIGGLIVVGIIVLVAVNAFAKGAGQGAVKSVKGSTAPSKGEASSE